MIVFVKTQFFHFCFKKLGFFIQGKKLNNNFLSQNMGNLLVTGSIFAWVWIRIKVWPGSITNVLKILDPDPPPLILYVHVVVERGGEHGADGRL